MTAIDRATEGWATWDEFLTEPVYPRWFGLMFIIWWSFGKPEIPVKRLWQRFLTYYREARGL